MGAKVYRFRVRGPPHRPTVGFAQWGLLCPRPRVSWTRDGWTGVSRFRRRRDQGGAAAVEFALILPIMLLLLFGLIQYGYYFYAMQAGSSAVGDAARRIAVGNCQTTGQVQTLLKNKLGPATTANSPSAINVDGRLHQRERQRRYGARRDRRLRPGDRDVPDAQHPLPVDPGPQRRQRHQVDLRPDRRHLGYPGAVLMNRFTRDERGAVAVIFGLTAALLLTLCALGVDLGQAWAQKRQIQASSDSATLAGAGIAGNDLPAPSAGKVCGYGTGATSSDPATQDVARYVASKAYSPVIAPAAVSGGVLSAMAKQLTDCNVEQRRGLLRHAEVQQVDQDLDPDLQQEPAQPGQPAQQRGLRLRRHPRHQRRRRGRGVHGRDPVAEDGHAAVLRLQRL